MCGVPIPCSVLALVSVVMALLIALWAACARFRRRPLAGQALLVRSLGGDFRVTFAGAWVFPGVHQLEILDCTSKAIRIDFPESGALSSRDGKAVHLSVTFFLRILQIEDSVRAVATSLGCARASTAEGLKGVLLAKFTEVVQVAVAQFDGEQLRTQREDLKDKIIELLGRDLNGLVLDDVALCWVDGDQPSALNGSS